MFIITIKNYYTHFYSYENEGFTLGQNANVIGEIKEA
jgi:hypothetical protein